MITGFPAAFLSPKARPSQERKHTLERYQGPKDGMSAGETRAVDQQPL
jgi:hypothetical protein